MDKRTSLLLPGITVLATALFVADLLLPLGFAIWVPYIAVVLLSLWLPSRWYAYLTAAVCTVLTVIGLFFPQGAEGNFWQSVMNRTMAIFAFWITAIVGLAARRAVELERAYAALQQETDLREKLESQFLRAQRLESIGILAGGIAHDFNNLLTPILMAVKLLKEERPEEERQQLLTTLQLSAERGADMIRQLLSFAGGADGERSPVQMKHVIKEVKAILDHTFPKSIKIHTTLQDVEPVFADATQLAQVLMNLCFNARDAMPRGGALTIRAENVILDEEYAWSHLDARPGPHALVTVADTGTGIAADLIDKVFDPFFTTKGQGKGTGLGLSTALGIVRSHGGFITVSSDLGKGSRFAIYLPALVGDRDRPTEPERLDLPEGQGELILVVDDEAFILETARATLEGHGYRVVTALEGSEAVALFKQRRGEIQAVLLDLMMPGMDGPATMAVLEEVDPRVRIIASSGLRPTGRVAQAIAAGEKAFLPKPYTDEQMLATLGKVLRGPPRLERSERTV